MTMMGLKGDIPTFKPQIGESVGAQLEFGSGTLTGQAGIFYSIYNAKLDAGDLHMKSVQDFIAIPVTGKVNFIPDSPNNVYFKFGMMPSFRTAQKQIAQFGDVSGSGLDIRNLDFPIVAGLGGAVGIDSQSSVIIEATFVRGMTNVNDSGDGSIRNEGFLLYAGYMKSL